jgi:hypothetical protein
VNADPAATATIGGSPPTATGVDDVVMVPLPSWPEAFAPQHETVPAEVTAQE